MTTAPLRPNLTMLAALATLHERRADAEALARRWDIAQDLDPDRVLWGLQDLGFRLFAEEGHRLPELTTVWVPDDLPEGLDEAAVRRGLLQRYGIEVGGGLGAYAGKVWRIGCMGHTARPRNVTLLLGALAEILGR